MWRAGRPTRVVWGALLLLALALRLLAAFRSGIIESDGAYYASLAAALLRHDWAHGLSTVWPPLYPALIALAAWPVRSFGVAPGPELLETCARAVSIVAGLALLVPLERIARRVAGERVALLAVACAAVHPRLVEYSGAALTESTFTVLLVVGVAAWCARRWAGAGLAFGLATLTRPEGIAFAALFWILGLVGAEPRGADATAISWRARFRPGFLIALLLALLPYLAFTTARTGAPTLGEKGAYNFWRAYQTDYARVLPEPVALSERVVDSPELGERLPRSRVDVLGFVTRSPGRIATRTLRNAATIVVSSLPIAVHPAFALLAVVGAFALRGRRPAPLLAPIALSVALYAPFSVDRRFFVPVAPFALVLAAAGAAWGYQRMDRAGARRAAAALGAALLVGHAAYAALRSRGIDEAPEHRAAGEWLRVHPLRRGGGVIARPIVMSRKPWVAYYSGGLNAELPAGTLDEVLARLRATRADVLVVDGRWAVPQRLALAPLLDARAAPPLLAPLHAIDRPRPVRMYRAVEAP